MNYSGNTAILLINSMLGNKTKKEREDEAGSRYGNLAGYMKPYNKVNDNRLKAEGMCAWIRQQKADTCEQDNIRILERIECAKKEEQEHIDRNDVYINFYLEKESNRI